MAALTVVAGVGEWRRLLWLVTAFTAGHSITLALATLDLVHVNPALVETLIPVTIVLASAANVAEWRSGRDGGMRTGQERIKYGLALFFGLIHGLGFSNYLRGLLGGEESIVIPLFAFNVGVEIGQLLIVAVLLLLGAVAVGALRLARRDWVLIVSGAAGGIALTMILDRLLAS